MKMMPALYCGQVTEYELGWGSRPDGWLVATTRSGYEAKQQEIHDQGDYELFYRASSPTLVHVTDEFFAKVAATEGQAMWTNLPSANWAVQV